MMIADVRQKVRMRARSALKVMQLAVANYAELDARFGLRLDANTVLTGRRDAVRGAMERVLPGCVIGVSSKTVWASLPARYPRSDVPVAVELDWYWQNYLKGHGWTTETGSTVGLIESREQRVSDILRPGFLTSGESKPRGADSDTPPF